MKKESKSVDTVAFFFCKFCVNDPVFLIVFVPSPSGRPGFSPWDSNPDLDWSKFSAESGFYINPPEFKSGDM